MTIIIINLMSVKHKNPDVAISNHINVIIAQEIISFEAISGFVERKLHYIYTHVVYAKKFCI